MDNIQTINDARSTLQKAIKTLDDAGNVAHYRERLERAYATVNNLVDFIGRNAPTLNTRDVEQNDIIILFWEKSGDYERLRVEEVGRETISGRIIRYQEMATMTHCECVLLDDPQPIQ